MEPENTQSQYCPAHVGMWALSDTSLGLRNQIKHLPRGPQIWSPQIQIP